MFEGGGFGWVEGIGRDKKVSGDGEGGSGGRGEQINDLATHAV